MSAKKVLEKYTEDEITDSLVIPQKLTVKQKREADLQLKKARKKTQSEMTEKDRLVARLLQLKFQIEDYLKGDDFKPGLTFGHFLKEYVSLSTSKRKHFAAEIDIDETELSQLINRHRLPNETIFIRLEIHSNNSIPAVIWYRLVEKEKEHLLRTDKELRKQQKKFVTKKLGII